MVKIRGKISTQRVSILIDSGARHSYISPKVLDDCKLSMKKHIKHWLVQLTTCAKQNNSELIKLFEMDLNYLKTSAQNGTCQIDDRMGLFLINIVKLCRMAVNL